MVLAMTIGVLHQFVGRSYHATHKEESILFHVTDVSTPDTSYVIIVTKKAHVNLVIVLQWGEKVRKM